MHDIIIVGAGTAGLTAAIYGVRAGKSVLVFENATYGGQIVSSPEVENYPGIKRVSGVDFAVQLYEQASEAGAKVEFAKVTGIQESMNQDPGQKAVLANEKVYPCKTIILATGAKNRPLGLERESELTGRGVSYCATCDGNFYKDKTVAVVGGGNTALEDAAFLTEYCKKVYVIHRRDTFRGEDKLVSVLKGKANLEFVLDTVVTKLIGEPLEAIECLHTKTNLKSTLAVEGLFVAIGQMPQNEDFAPPVQLDKSGYLIAAEDCRTNIPGIFAAGDCRTKTIRQLSTATADGTVAALGACEYILHQS